MNKIKKFKISLRQKDIARRILRSNLDLKTAGIASDIELARFIVDVSKSLNPGVVYKLFKDDYEGLEAVGITARDIFSVCVVTLGEEIEEKLKEFEGNQTLQIAANIALTEFLRTAFYFVSDLISDQAKKEEFETEGYELLYSPVFSYAPEPKFIAEAVRMDKEMALKAMPVLFESLNTAKIGVAVQEGEVTPKATIAFLIPWQKKKKRKK
ncbi:hypothetical protein Dip510_002036 [Elusimicrobium posterum]|uniref:hypothetical protein n=1 Tax=Elusimicrobium posterum TaxID=3116653 RepID=UPI003C753175